MEPESLIPFFVFYVMFVLKVLLSQCQCVMNLFKIKWKERDKQAYVASNICSDTVHMCILFLLIEDLNYCYNTNIDIIYT